MESKKKYLIKNIVLFSLNVVGTKLVAFFLVPLYTNSLSTSDYGIVDLITTLGAIIIPVITFNIGESVMRFSLDKDADFPKIVTVIVIFSILAPIIGLLIFIPVSFFESLKQIRVYVYLFCVIRGISQIYISYLRGREKLLGFAIGNIFHSIVIACFNILFLLVFHWGVKGYFLAQVLSDILLLIFAFFCGEVCSLIPEFKFDSCLLKKMLSYSAFLIPNSLLWWITDSSDKVMLSSMIGYEANGICSIAYKIPGLLAVFASVFNQAWSYSAIKEHGELSEIETSQKMLSVLIDFLLLSAGILIISCKPFYKIYVSDAFFSAWQYVPILAMAYLFNSLATFLGTSYSVYKNSKGYLYSALIGAGVNISLNFLLIPFFEIYGAVIATCISYFSVFIFRVFNTKKYLNLKIQKTSLLYGLFILALLIFIIYSNCKFRIYILLILLFILLFISRSCFALLFNILRNFFRRRQA